MIHSPLLRKKILPFTWNFGIFLVVCGVIRQSFADLLMQQGFGQTLKNGPLPDLQFSILSVGIRFGLFPLDHFMTLDEKKWNLELATLGFLLMVIAGIVGMILKARE